jgi:hypothetical protein
MEVTLILRSCVQSWLLSIGEHFDQRLDRTGKMGRSRQRAPVDFGVHGLRIVSVRF